MTQCSNCKQDTLNQEPHGWFCSGCGAVGLGQQGDLRERPCVKCQIMTFDDLCYICWKKEKDERI